MNFLEYKGLSSFLLEEVKKFLEELMVLVLFGFILYIFYFVGGEFYKLFFMVKK